MPVLIHEIEVELTHEPPPERPVPQPAGQPPGAAELAEALDLARERAQRLEAD